MELKDIQQFTENLLKEYQDEHKRTKSAFDKGAAIALETVLEFIGGSPAPVEKAPAAAHDDLKKAKFNPRIKFSFFHHFTAQAK